MDLIARVLTYSTPHYLVRHNAIPEFWQIVRFVLSSSDELGYVPVEAGIGPGHFPYGIPVEPDQT